MPALLSASRTAFIADAFAESASEAVAACELTPKLQSATSGTTSAVPLPTTVIPLPVTIPPCCTGAAEIAMSPEPGFEPEFPESAISDPPYPPPQPAAAREAAATVASTTSFMVPPIVICRALTGQDWKRFPIRGMPRAAPGDRNAMRLACLASLALVLALAGCGGATPQTG